MQATTIAVPVLNGLLYALGASWVYAPTATLYALTYILALNLPVRNQPLTQDKATLDSLLIGIRFIRSRLGIFGVISPGLFVVLLGDATALLPVFTEDILLTRPWGLGLLRSAPTVGVLMTSFWLAHSSIKCNIGRIMFFPMGIFNLATIAFGPLKSF